MVVNDLGKMIKTPVAPARTFAGAALAVLVFIGPLLLAAEPASRVPDPVQWTEAMLAFADEDVISPPPENAVVFTGSSSIALWKTLQEDMAPLTVINRGFGGSTMPDALYWIDETVLKYRPRAVVLYEGDNDIGSHGSAPDELLEGFKQFVSRVHAEFPEARIYFLAVKPSVLRWGVWPEMRRANELIRSYCDSRPRLHFLDVASPMLDAEGRPRPDIFEADELHMNEMGYEIWTSVVKPVLLRREAAD
jgi:lysophospholipase L1-like esterase